MKSYCIKVNNNKVIEYLLNKIELINFDHIYYCEKEFKLYKNVFLHYVGNNIEGFDRFVANLLTQTILEMYEKKILKRMIHSNYFYFDEYEKKIILENCMEIEKAEMRTKKEQLYLEIEEYIKENNKIVLEGVINFRINEYLKILDEIVDMGVNQYIIEKEYTEFINLLKVYVSTTPSQMERAHLIYLNGESILLDENKNVVSISENILNAKYLSDITFSSNDFALNTLLNLLPQKLEIHVIDEEDEFINTLKLIFEEKISICKDCNICKTYKMINHAKILQ